MKNKILIGITYLMIMIVLIGMCAMDSEDQTIPILMIGLPMIWLVPFFTVNKSFLEGGED